MDPYYLFDVASDQSHTTSTMASPNTINASAEMEANFRRLESSKQAISRTAEHLDAVEQELKASEKEFKMTEDALSIAKQILEASRRNADRAEKEHQEAVAELKDAEECANVARKKSNDKLPMSWRMSLVSPSLASPDNERLTLFRAHRG